MSASRRLLARSIPFGVLLLAAVAAAALMITVAVARRDLQAASEALIRGEGTALANQLLESLESKEALSVPPTPAQLEALVQERAPEGLRYLGLGRDGELTGGASLLRRPGLRVGDLIVRGNRALIVLPLPGPPGGPGGGPPRGPWSGPPPPGPGVASPPPWGPPPPTELGQPTPFGPHSSRPHGPMVILEFEPAILSALERGVSRMTWVASLAIAALLALGALLTASLLSEARRLRLAEADRRLRALGQMSAVMAHELRNPLASLKGNAQLLLETLPTDSPDLAKAQRVVAEAQRLQTLTTDLLGFVRAGPLQLETLSTAELCERALAGTPRERIELDLTAAPAAIESDPPRLALALSNLLRNALQSSPPQSPVQLRVRRAGGQAHFEVRDFGPGIPQGQEEEIFEPFVTHRVQGTGLGLAVARQVAAQHGGTLTVENADGGGARFRVSFPLEGLAEASPDTPWDGFWSSKTRRG